MQNLTSKGYEVLIRTQLVPFMDTFPESLYLIQDNAPAHRSYGSRVLMANNRINLLRLPPYSPDLNPIG